METGPDRQQTITITTGTVIKTVVVLAVCILLYFMRDLVVVILTAIVVASAIEPLIVWLGKYKIARTLAVIAVYLLLALALAGIFYFFVPSLVADLSDLFNNLPSYINTVSVWNPFNTSLSSAVPVVHNLNIANTFSFDSLIAQMNGLIAGTSQSFIQAISTLFGGLLSLVLIIVLSFYFAVQEDGVTQFLKIVLPIKHEQYLIDLWRRSQTKIGKWLQGQFLLGVLIGVLVYLGLTVFGIRNALILALLAGIFEIIPVFGPILFAIPGIIIAVLDGGLTKGILVAGFYVIIQQFENHLVYPLVVRKIVGVPPILVILAVIVGFKLAGILGIILSVPIAATLVEFLNDVQKEKIARAVPRTS